MEWDYFVYSRGVDKNDGYTLRIGADYLPMRACIAFLDKTLTEDSNSVWKETGINPFEKYPDTRKNSFVYIDVARAKSCILMRTLPICSPGGEPMCDFQGRALWSLEGIYCPYERRNEFFAAIPSILLALKRDEQTLQTHYENGDKKYCIPDELVFNAYADQPLPPSFYDIIENESERIAFQNLANAIYCSEQPYSFTYGALSKGFLVLVGDMFKINIGYSLINPVENEPADSFFKSYKPLDISKSPDSKRMELVLECGIHSGKENAEFLWRIRSVSNEQDSYELCSMPESFPAEAGRRMGDLMARALAVQDFAKQMLWEISENSEYKYYKEG